MKKFFVLLLLLFSINMIAAAQEMSLLDIDFDFLDSIFNEPSEEFFLEADVESAPILQHIRRHGIGINASYEFQGAVNPGWDVYPWELEGGEHFSWALGIRMSANIGIHAQVSDNFRVISVVGYSVPGYFHLGDFFFDYNFYNRVFLRTGKFEQGWGTSPNFGFTNLLSRVPDQGPSGPSYLIKFDMPIGVGGLQALAMSRANIAGGVIPARHEIGFGGLYNLANRWADFNLGMYYQRFMPTRGFLSAKTTIFGTELYNEWLIAVNTHTDDSASFAFNVGFARSFFADKIDLNGEFFYNGEGYTYFFKPESDFQAAGISPFLEGINMALNFLYRFNGRGSPRFFSGIVYSYAEESASFVPGFRLNPFPNIELYLAAPMALGSKEGHYYRNAVNVKNEIRPFSIVLYITFSGGVHAAYYY